MGSITHAQNEIHRNEQDAGVSKDVEEVFAKVYLGACWVDFAVCERASNEEEDEVKVGQREVGEKQLNELVDKFDVKQNLSEWRMTCLPDLFEMQQRIDSCKEGTIQPSSALRNELGNSICNLR